MLNIIPSGYKKILKLFYENKNSSFYLREISKKTGLNENSTYRFLKKLEEEKILKSKKEGNLKLFFLNKNEKVYLINSFFDIERFEKLPSIRKKAINSYIEKLPKMPVFIILFGSTAKNTFKKNSDIDILIVTDKRIKTEKAEYYVDAKFGIKPNTFQISYKNFFKELKLKEDKIVQTAIKTGYPLINHLFYYKVIENESL